jgi:AraC-like DNA-binding protein
VVSETGSLKVAINFIRAFVGADFAPTKIFLTSPRRCISFDAEASFDGVSVQTDAQCAAIEFPTAFLGTPNPRLINGAQRPPDNGAGHAPLPDSVCDSIQAIVAPYLPDGGLRIEAAAEMAGLSLRTLQRKLADEGTSYTEVIDRARCRSTMALLRQDCADLNDIALEVGYSERAAFIRAFRRWTGETPRRYQARLLNGEIT